MNDTTREHIDGTPSASRYIAGGEVGRDASARTTMYSLSQDELTARSDMTTPRAWHGMVALDGRLYAFGGKDNALRELNTMVRA